MKQSNLYIFSNGRVAAINKKTGEIAWEVKIKDVAPGSYSRWTVGQIHEDDGKLFVGVSGVLICLDARDGKFLWQNRLKGWGYNFVSIAGADNSAAAASLYQKQAAAASAG